MACFEVLYVQAIPCVVHGLFVLYADQDLELSAFSHHAFLPAAMLFAMIKRTKPLTLQAHQS